jgi:energy-coupling factor transporter ATP-binding protein EcfA2
MLRRKERSLIRKLLADLILADEPFAAVDPVTTERVFEALLDLNREGATLLVNLHDVELARRFPRVVALRELHLAHALPVGVQHPLDDHPGLRRAGGIGQQILVSMNLFDYPKVATLVGTTIIIVLLVDRFSAAVRSRVVY